MYTRTVVPGRQLVLIALEKYRPADICCIVKKEKASKADTIPTDHTTSWPKVNGL